MVLKTQTRSLTHALAATHDWKHGGILVETFCTLFSGCWGELRARPRTDAVYLHVGAQRYGLVHRHDAKQRAGGRPEDHDHTAAGDRAAAKGDHCESKGDDQGTNVQVDPLRESEPPGGGGSRREAAGVQEHDGGCITGHHGNSGPAGADFTDAQTETGESRGMQAEERSTNQVKS